MALVSTTLAAACAAADQFINVTSTTGTAVGQIWRVDSEFMTQIAAASGNVIPVSRRGTNGSTVQAHTILAPVVNGVAGDFPAPQPGTTINPAPWEKQIVSYGASGAITLPTCNTLIFLDKATAAAMTLASPSAAVDGIEVTIYSNTAAAHTVTYTPGFNGDTTSSDVATFPATKGNSMTIIASKGLWGLKCVYGVSVA